MDRSQYPGLLVFAGLARASDREPGVVSSGPEKYVLSFFAKIAYWLTRRELGENAQFSPNLYASQGLQQLGT